MVDYSKYPNSVLVGAAVCVHWNYEEDLRILGVNLNLNSAGSIFSAISELLLKNATKNNFSLEQLNAIHNVKSGFLDICDFCNEQLNSDSQANEVLLRYRNGLIIVSKSDAIDYNYSYTGYNYTMPLAYQPEVIYSSKMSVDTELDEMLESFKNAKTKSENLKV